jgi:hypothetical protein
LELLTAPNVIKYDPSAWHVRTKYHCAPADYPFVNRPASQNVAVHLNWNGWGNGGGGGDRGSFGNGGGGGNSWG